MAQKKPAPPAKAPKGPNLSSLRGQIDKIDKQILDLVNERAAVAVEIGKVKSQDGAFVYAPERESEVLDRVSKENPGPLDELAIRALYREIISGTRAIQRRVRICYLGPAYSFSHLAVIEKFGQSVEFFPVNSISGVFEAVHRGQTDLGIVPIENSTDGRIADTLDMFMKLPLKICGEVSLRIHHNLVANCDQSEIQRVYSRPQALSQCRNWLTTNVPQAQIREVASTTTAVQLAKQEPFAAAVASRQAANAHELRILASHIEDRENNTTRFAVIGHTTAARTGDDKTSLMFQLSNEPGTLFDAIESFKLNKLNMEWIESFPAGSGKSIHEYVFFVDVAGHIDDPKVKKTLGVLEKKCTKVVVLGSYPRGDYFE
jgi:chorismate mutase/prephenate dehydratase